MVWWDHSIILDLLFETALYQNKLSVAFSLPCMVYLNNVPVLYFSDSNI